MTGQYYTPLPWIATSVYYAHGGHSDRHNDTIVTLPHMPRSHLPCDPRVSWHISGTDSVHGKRRTHFFLITAALLSVCRMWCHRPHAFRNPSVLMVTIINVLLENTDILKFSTQRSVTAAMLISHFSAHSNFHTASSSCLSVRRVLPPDPPHVWWLCALPAGVPALPGEGQRPHEGHEARGQHRWGRYLGVMKLPNKKIVRL